MKRLNCVLLIDDDSVSNYISEAVLRGMGAASMITVVGDGRKGLDYLKYQCTGSEEDDASCPELILLDVNMPNMDGLEFLKMYQRQVHVANKIIIILSALDLPENEKEKFRKAGATDFLVKPFTAEKLSKIFEQYFEHA